MAYSAIVHDDGELVIPPTLLEELGWRVGDDLEIENAEAGLIVRRQSSDRPEI